MKEINYVILGIEHRDIEQPLRNAAARHAPRLIAEEYPFDSSISSVARVATELGIRYLQIDMYPNEQIAAGIYDELQKSQNFPFGGDFRLSNADDVREEFWLNKIEQNFDVGRVLIVCGCHHVHFLAEKVKARGATVVEKILFPPNLTDGSQRRALSPAELDEELKRKK